MKRNLKENRVDNSSIQVTHISTISKRIPIQEIWPCEEYNFTPWLSDNIDELSKVLGINLEVINIEQSAGRYELDIYARDTYDGSTYAIENQFGESDNVHVGKAPMYAAILDASNVVWIGEKMLPEHKRYYEWLNDHTSTDNNFWGVEVHCFSINGVKAYEFEVVVKPNNLIKRYNTLKSAGSMSEAVQKVYSDKEAFWNIFKSKACKDASSFRTDERSLAYAWYNEDIKSWGKISIVISTKQKTVTVGIQTQYRDKYEDLINDFISENNISGLDYIHYGTKNDNWCFWDRVFSYEESPVEIAEEAAVAYNTYAEQFGNLK